MNHTSYIHAPSRDRRIRVRPAASRMLHVPHVHVPHLPHALHEEQGSNTIAFKLNVNFVFNRGRHSKTKEVILFFTVSGISFFSGLLSIPLVFNLIDSNKGIEHFANGAFIISSALVNFVCRKYIIFAKQ